MVNNSVGNWPTRVKENPAEELRVQIQQMHIEAQAPIDPIAQQVKFAKIQEVNEGLDGIYEAT